MKKNTDESMVLRFRVADTPSGLTRSTWRQVAQAHGLSETEAIHRAMVMFASRPGVEEMRKASQGATVGYPSDLSGWDFGNFAEALAKAVPDLLDKDAPKRG
jgi:hypothetical protein